MGNPFVQEAGLQNMCQPLTKPGIWMWLDDTIFLLDNGH